MRSSAREGSRTAGGGSKAAAEAELPIDSEEDEEGTEDDDDDEDEEDEEEAGGKPLALCDCKPPLLAVRPFLFLPPLAACCFSVTGVAASDSEAAEVETAAGDEEAAA